MFLLHSFTRAFRLVCSKVCCGGDSRRQERNSESVALLSEQSSHLSYGDGFRDFFHSKRALLMGLCNLILYIILAILGYSYIFESWPVVDSIYFAVVVFTTIGYGDLSPSTDIGRVFTICFAMYGILILGLFLGLIGEVVVEVQEQAFTKTKSKAREQVKFMFSVPESSNGGPDQQESQEQPDKTLLVELWHVVLLEAPIVALMTVIAILIGASEGWSVIKSIYFGFITSTTVGFGDLHPYATADRIVAIVFLPLSVAVFGEVMGRLAGVYLDRKARMAQHEFLHRQLTRSDIELMDVNRDGKVSMGEFLSFMLVAMQKVEREDVEELRQLFYRLDVTGDGQLDKEDLAILAKRRRESLA